LISRMAMCSDSHRPKSLISSSLISCFITLGRCDLMPTPAFRHGHRLARWS
jgi:hypothetical protein